MNAGAFKNKFSLSVAFFGFIFCCCWLVLPYLFFFKCNIITYTYFVLDERRRSRSRVKCWSLFFKPIFRCTCTISIEHFWAKKMSNFSLFLLFRCLLRFFNAAICSTYHKIPRFYWMTLHTRFGQKRYSYLLPFVSHQRRVFDHSPSRRLIELKF